MTNLPNFQKLLANSHEHVALTDMSGKILYTNGGVEAILGYTASEYAVLDMQKAVHPEDFPLVENFYQQVFSQALERQTVIIRSLNKHGQYVWTEIHGTNLLHDSDVQGILFQMTDATSRMASKEQLRRYGQRMSILHQLDLGIISGASVAQLIENALQCVRELVPCALAFVALYDWQVGEGKIFVRTSELNLEQAPTSIPIPTEWLENFPDENYLIIDDIDLLVPLPSLYVYGKSRGIRSYLHVLLRRHDEVMGVYTLGALTPNFFKEEYQEIAAEIASQLAIALSQRLLDQERRAQAEALAQQVSNLEKAEKALSLSEKRYRTVIEDQTDLICRYDADCRLTFVNQAYADVFGDSPENLIGTIFLERIPENERQAAIDYVKTLTPEKPTATYEHPAIMPDGTERWHQWTDIAIFDDAGQLIEYQGVGRDITERIRAEIAEANERRFRDALLGALAALSTSTDFDSIMTRILTQAAEVVPCDAGSIILFEGDYGRIAYWRGFSPEAAKSFETMRIPIEKTMLRLSRQASYIIMDTQENENWQTFTHSEWIRSSLGIPIIVEGRVIGVLSSESGLANYFNTEQLMKLEAFALYAGIALERVFYVQRLEEEVTKRTGELKQTSQELESILDNSFEPILLLGADLEILRSNPAYHQLMRQNELLASKLIDLILPSEQAKFQEFFEKLVTVQGAEEIELTLRRADGSDFEAELSLSYIAVQPQRFVANVRNVSERKAYERQLLYHASLQQNVQDAVIVTDLNYVIQSWNKAAESIYGWSETDVVGKLSAEILKTEFGDQANRAYFLNELRLKQSVTGEYIQGHKDGHRIHIFASTTIVKDSTGQPFAVISINRDVSERKKMELALNAKLADELEFQNYLKALHEINIELSKLDNLDEFYKRAVELGREHFGFERMGFLLYDEAQGMVTGTYGTNRAGETLAEAHIKLQPNALTGIIGRSLLHQERFVYEADAALYDNGVYIGQGWNAVATLWTGEKNLGCLAVDNGVKNRPARKPMLDILALYATNLGAILSEKRIAISLRESEERYRLIVDTISDMVIRLDVDATYRYVSPASKLILGYEPEELIGKSGLDFIYPEDLPKIEAAVTKAIVEHETYQPLPVRFIHKDGHHVWLEITGRTIFSETGAPLGFTTSSRDISKRVAIEAALTASEERFRLFMEEAPIAIVVTNKSGKVVLVNTEAEELLAYKRYEIIGKPIEILVPEAKRQGHEAKRNAYVEKPNKRTMGNVEELFARRKDGGLFWADIQLSYIETEDDLLVMAFMQDISERKLSEEALKLYATEVEDLYNKAPCGYHSLDANGLIVAINDTELQWLGYEREEVLGKLYISDILSANSKATFQQNFPTFKAQGWVNDLEFEFVRKDGTSFFVSLSATAILDENGHFVMSRTTLFDISERKEAQRLLEQALAKEKELGELKTRFVSMASHEFRTPLSVIKSSTDMVLRYGERQGLDWSKEKLGKVSEQIGYLTGIMNDVLNLGRLQSGKTQFNPSKGSLAELCQKILEDFRMRPDISHEFIEQIADDLPEIMLDSALMRQLISNLLSNATKYSRPAMPVTLRLAQEADTVILEVSDKGIGIPAADLSHLFEPFHRAANVGAIQGTGMGLSITKEIAEKHGGTITAESTLGQGTKMIVRLPLQVTSNE